MYEEKTFETILNEMLNNVSDNFDKREGSVIYDALAPVAVELAQMYINIDYILNQIFADTAEKVYLIKRAKERGLELKKATYAILKGEFNINIDIGSRFNLGDLNYIVIDRIDENLHTYKLQCETLGMEGHVHFGDLIPVDYIDGLTKAKITEVLIPAQDEEETENFRERYFNSFNSMAFGGNRADYEEKINQIQGVGDCKVYRVNKESDYIKIVIIDSEYNIPSDSLINLIQQKIDANKDGSGDGIVPIGHIVKIEKIKGFDIEIKTNIIFDIGYTFENIKSYILESIERYFLELRKSWKKNTNLIVHISQIESRILNINGILNVTNTTINGNNTSIYLENDTIPFLKGVINE